MNEVKLVAVVLGIALLSGCSSTQPSEPGSVPEQASSPESAQASGAGLEFETPSTWIKETPSSSMRLAQYRLPRLPEDSEDAELAVFYFGGQGGTVQANVERWIGQFSDPNGSPLTDAVKVSERDTDGIHLTIVDVSGTYHQAQGPMMAATTDKPNYRMLAAVADGPTGPTFFKLTGPQGTVDHFEDSFQRMLDTVRIR